METPDGWFSEASQTPCKTSCWSKNEDSNPQTYGMTCYNIYIWEHNHPFLFQHNNIMDLTPQGD